MNCAIVVAGGKSERMGKGVDKSFLSLGSKPVVVYSLLAFERCADIEEVILVVRPERVESARSITQMFGCNKVRKIVGGGQQRQISVMKGLEQVEENVEIVVVHDGARPCVTAELISETVRNAQKHGSGVAALKITDTVKEVRQGLTISRTVDRTNLWTVQTPQAFRRELLVKAMDFVKKKKLAVTDEASAVERVCKDVRLVVSTPFNVKITTPDDLVLAAALMRL